MLSKQSLYAQSGVKAQNGALSGLLKYVKQTKGFNKDQPSIVSQDYFCDVLDFGHGIGVAFCTDGVGSKILVAEMMNQYDTIGIDCVAMNVNDIICVGAKPVSMVDYIACSVLDEKVFEELGKGLMKGAEQARISIVGGEIAQIKEMISGIDLMGSCIGFVPTKQINTGKEVKPGNLILGMASSGVHANGLTLARKILLGETLKEQKKNINKFEDSFNRTIGAELLEPTCIYVRPIMEMIDSGIDLKAMVQITSSGYANLNRVEGTNIRFVIDPLPDVPPVFELIQEQGSVSDAEMYKVFNMGIGFCIIVDHANDADLVQQISKKYGISCHRIGYVEEFSGKETFIPELNLRDQTVKSSNK